jgi:sigma-E factor negative regulatory protein RseB
MTKTFILILVLLFTGIPLYAGNDLGIFFKIAVDDKTYSSLTVTNPDNLNKKFRFITQKIRNNYFDNSYVNKIFYKVKIYKNIPFMNKKIIIYELDPKYSDRFKQIIWIFNNIIIRREIYSLKEKLILAYGYIDKLPEKIKLNENNYYKYDNIKDYHIFYKGFKVTFFKNIKKNIKHLLFEDGINNFSVFIQNSFENSLKSPFEKESIFMGNYVYQKKINNELFTIVGTIPFMEMKKIIPYIKEIMEDKTK